MVKLLDTSGKNETNAIVLISNTNEDTNTITKESKGVKNNNKSTYKISHRNYYLKNREKILDREHQRYIENRDYWKQYYRERTKNNNPSNVIQD